MQVGLEHVLELVGITRFGPAGGGRRRSGHHGQPAREGPTDLLGSGAFDEELGFGGHVSRLAPDAPDGNTTLGPASTRAGSAGHPSAFISGPQAASLRFDRKNGLPVPDLRALLATMHVTARFPDLPESVRRLHTGVPVRIQVGIEHGLELVGITRFGPADGDRHRDRDHGQPPREGPAYLRAAAALDKDLGCGGPVSGRAPDASDRIGTTGPGFIGIDGSWCSGSSFSPARSPRFRAVPAMRRISLHSVPGGGGSSSP